MPKEEKIVTVGKARYWWGVLYPENMIEGWQDTIGEILQLPYCYVIHDDDLEKEFENQEQKKRKEHIHLIVCFGNTTTYNHAFKIFSLLNAPDKKAINKIEAIRSIRHSYEYLIHNTESAKKENKKQYPASARKSGNNFDIGSYEQISTTEKMAMSKAICNYIIENRIGNFVDLFLAIQEEFDDSYFEVLQSNSGFYERLIKGNHYKACQREAALAKINRADELANSGADI